MKKSMFSPIFNFYCHKFTSFTGTAFTFPYKKKNHLDKYVMQQVSRRWTSGNKDSSSWEEKRRESCARPAYCQERVPRPQCGVENSRVGATLREWSWEPTEARRAGVLRVQKGENFTERSHDTHSLPSSTWQGSVQPMCLKEHLKIGKQQKNWKD